MARSLKKGIYTDDRLMKKVQKALASKDKSVIKTWARSSTITPEMVGMKFGVHNGKIFIEVLVTENMVGHRLGEFSLTRKFVKHGGKMQKDQEKAAADAQRTAKAPAPAGKK